MRDQASNPKAGRGRPRFREILGILTKHGLTKGLTPLKVRLVLEDLGPTYVKIGQLMSMRTDMIPDEYCEELAKLRTQVAPMRIEEVRSVIQSLCGMSCTELFPVFDERALGSASIAQVHYAELPDGSPVAVKIQRIGIYETMSKDIVLLRRAAKLLNLASGMAEVFDFTQILDELWKVAQEEMDFLIEARNTEEFRSLNSEVAFATCPKIYRNLSNSKVLVMEYIEGLEIEDREGLLAEGYDLNEIGIKLSDNYIKQIVEDGFFHADPHPGNIRIRDGKIVWIDLGMMGRLSARDQLLMNKVLLAIAAHDVGTIKDVLLALGDAHGRVEHSRLYSDIDDFLNKYGSMDLGGMDLAKVLKNLMDVARTHRISMPAGISMLARGIATMEGVMARTCPELNLLNIASARMAGSIFSSLDWRKEIGSGLSTAADSGRKLMEIPSLLNELIRMTTKGQSSVNLELHNSPDFKNTLYSVVSDMIKGLLVAALIVGSSLIATTEMRPQLLGIPALGFIGYLAALLFTGKIFYDTWKKK